MADVQKGVAALDAAADPDLWRQLAAGLSLGKDGLLEVSGELKAVKPANRPQVALYAARRAGLLDGCKELILCGKLRNRIDLPDLSPLIGLPLERLTLSYASYRIGE